ncbi:MULTISPECIES: pyridoxamine 5'-phosphate oxidase family protein [unclassified Sedimentibacter]|uniref:pyridoxamine 5'-phosphate oxidase family protein n=1 Tax=unclassified Sedimentibacter TaxID=2649220 RepID=UPI0027DFD0A2|nr:pyridoxamine 5'-phosphate oxidase family protein [Sedimentibacter sp. MB35-C1]WMJ76201.1 pyridoxamine 5'-phosphate oxidase family protein [Sedimentibacter sp. MB35-C1]
MFHKMRRKDKQMSAEESIEILKRGEVGILSTICENGYPYGVPLNYVYLNNSIYFHCAKDGQKLSNIKNSSKVSFCVYHDVELLPEKFDTNYKSVILFGKASEACEEEKYNALVELIKKYSGDYLDKGLEYIDKAKNSAKVYKISIDHVTGKTQK